MSNTLARVRIKDFANTAQSAAQDDFLALDGETNGTRRISAEGYLKPLTLRVDALEGVGGNLNAYDFGTGTPTQEQLTVYAIGQIWPGYTDLSYNEDNPAQSTFKDAGGNPHTAAEIFNATRVKNLSDDSVFMLTNTQDTEPKVFDWANTGKEVAENVKQLGEIYFSLSNLTKYNPGAILINAPKTLTKAAADYSNLVQFVQDNPSINKTLSEWQSYYEANGQCPYFALTEDGAGDYNLRLPVVKEYIKAVNPDDGAPAIKAALAGLPNHLHAFGRNSGDNSGSFVGTSEDKNYNFGSEKIIRSWNGSGGGGGPQQASGPYQGNMVTTLAQTDNSNEDGVYGASDTVTPAHITLYPWLYVFYNNTNPGNQPIPEELLPATSERLGGVKIGAGLNITEDGTLSAAGGSASGDTPAVDLGQVTSASFEVNKNYAASVSGSAAFTLPTPADSTIANKITLSLNVLANSVINWGVNANADLAQFEPGKYQIRLLWNNNSSEWSAEVLKETEASSSVKLLVRFNGNMIDESKSPITLTPGYSNENFPVYTEGQYGQKKLVCNQDYVGGIHLIASGDNLSKLNLGTGDFTIKYWSGFGNYGDYIFKKDVSNYISIKYNNINIKFNSTNIVNKSGTFADYNSTGYVAITRQNGVLYIFINGNLVHSQASTEEWDLSGFTRIFDEVRSGNSIQELIVKNTCDYVANFTVPSAPFVLADNGVSDLHDDKKENISNKTSDYTAAGTGTYPSSKALKDAVSYLEGLIAAATPPTPDYANAAEFSKAANTNYTCPAAGWIQIRSAVFTAAAGSAGYAKISINGKDIRDYYVSNSSATTYTWSNNAGSNFAGETLIEVAQGDTVKFYADGFTMSNATFEGTFVPQAA
ncbi:MAG: hypothetical protein ACI352_03170 [Elusimicrobiaceae bacterium]